MTALQIVRHGTHFTIGVKLLEQATVISVFGLPIGWEMAGIDANIDRVIPRGWDRLIFDFSKTDFADSALLTVVRTYWQATEADPGRQVFIVAEPETTMHEKLVLTGISRRVPLHPTLDDALRVI